MKYAALPVANALVLVVISACSVTSNTTNVVSGNDAGADSGTGGNTDAAGALSGDGGAGSSGGVVTCPEPPAPDASRSCPGPDPYESNNDRTTAKDVSLSGCGRGRTAAGTVQGDEDWFSFVTSKSDPVLVTVPYTVKASDTTDLAMYAQNATGAEEARDTSSRTGLSETMTAEFQGKAGARYTVQIVSDSATCTAYELAVNTAVCSDTFEDNDEVSKAASVALDATSQASLSASVDGLDEDWYQFVAPKSDPVSVVVQYTRPTGDTVDLSIYASDAPGTEKDRDTTSRSTNSESPTVKWEAVAGAPYRIHVTSSERGVCAPYTMAVNGLFCTDTFEDNDTFATAVPLPAGAQNAKITGLDEDFYRLTNPGATGKCTVSYTVDAASRQDVSIYLLDTTEGEISRDTNARSGLSETATVSWTAGAVPTVLRVAAGEDECTSVVVTCQ